MRIATWWSLAALALSTVAKAQGLDRQAVVLGNDGYLAIARLPQDTVALIAWRGLSGINLRTDSVAAARLAADSVTDDSSFRITGPGDTITMSLTRVAGGGCRLDARGTAAPVSITFDSGSARTLWRVLAAPLAVVGFPDSGRRGLVYTDLQVQDAAKLMSMGPPGHAADASLQMGRGGRVVAQYVVDTAGHVRLETFSVVGSTNVDYVPAARDQLHTAHYTPALLWGRPVNQWVVQTMDFVPPRPLRP
jgi:hypothetical protein